MAVSLSQLSNHLLLSALRALVAQDRRTTAEMLAHLAEVDARKLYVPAGHPSMFNYCVRELRFSEDEASKRIRVARAAREIPVIFELLADRRLSMSTALMIAPHLERNTAPELLAAAAGKTRTELELLLAQRFPQPDVPTVLRQVPASAPVRVSAAEAMDLTEPQSAPGRISLTMREQASGNASVAPPAEASSPAATPPARPAPPARVAPLAPLAPLAPARFALQATLSQETHDKLRYAQELLGHAVPNGDLAQVLDRALDALIIQLERRKFAKVARLGRPRATRGERCVPAHVRHEVWKRDGGRWTFVGDKGQRCESRVRLEFDHVDPVARGGTASVAGIRLRCRAHNQFAAEQVYGAGFMQRKRAAARAVVRVSAPSQAT